MMQCPKCGRYMIWYMYYQCGMPISGWKCLCGFDSLTDYRVRVIVSNKRKLDFVKSFADDWRRRGGDCE